MFYVFLLGADMLWKAWFVRELLEKTFQKYVENGILSEFQFFNL